MTATKLPDRVTRHYCDSDGKICTSLTYRHTSREHAVLWITPLGQHIWRGLPTRQAARQYWSIMQKSIYKQGYHDADF